MNNDDTDDLRSLRPHAVPNMPTAIGRLVERLGYGWLLGMAAVVIAMATGYYAIASTDHGIGTNDVLDGVYFSIVTFTSLGYGDIQPKGFGRVIAALLVLCGLAITALTIGKVASERQSALLLLLHTSDVQRRLSSFAGELMAAAEAVAIPGNSQSKNLKSTANLIQAVSSYLSFNSFQARTVSFGNFAALTKLYDALQQTFDACIAVCREGKTPETMTRALRCARLIDRLVHLMDRLHGAEPGRRVPPVHTHSRREAARTAAKAKATSVARAVRQDLAACTAWAESGFNALQIERVFREMPLGQKWPQGIHSDLSPYSSSRFW